MRTKMLRKSGGSSKGVEMHRTTGHRAVLSRSVVFLAAVALVLGSSATGPGGLVDNVSITRAGDSWVVGGVTPGSPSLQAENSTATTLGDGKYAIDVGAGARVVLTDGQGRFSGLLVGDAPPIDAKQPPQDSQPAVHSLSYVVDRDHGTIIVAWVPITGADEYRVTAPNGKPVVTQSTEIVLPISNVSPEDMVVVEAIGTVPGLGSNELIGTMSVILPAAAFNTGTMATAADVAGGQVAAAALPNNTTFTFKTFIPDLWVPAPELCGGSWPFPNDNYFHGDNRSWSFSSTAYRTKAITVIYWGSTTDTTAKIVGQSKLYKKNANGTYTLLETRTASNSGITWYGPNEYGTTRKNFITYHTVQNPFCLGPIGTIDYQISVVVDRIAGYNGFTAYGTHDRAPNYELYYQDSTSSTAYGFYFFSRGSFLCLNACPSASFSVVR
jgi:hypothetical protein